MDWVKELWVGALAIVGGYVDPDEDPDTACTPSGARRMYRYHRIQALRKRRPRRLYAHVADRMEASRPDQGSTDA